MPWNHAAARNLGAVYARSDKLLLTDVDHEFPEEALRRILDLGSLRRTMYVFSRVDERGAPTKRHLNTFLLSRGRYLELFGYDEEFCGHYGLEDDLFRRWHHHHGTRIRFLPGAHIKQRAIVARARTTPCRGIGATTPSSSDASAGSGRSSARRRPTRGSSSEPRSRSSRTSAGAHRLPRLRLPS